MLEAARCAPNDDTSLLEPSAVEIVFDLTHHEFGQAAMLVGAFAKLRPIGREDLVQYRVLRLSAWTNGVSRRGLRCGTGW